VTFVTIRAGTYRATICERDGEREQTPWCRTDSPYGRMIYEDLLDGRRGDGWKVLYALRVIQRTAETRTTC
jgi:hypothetical protein